MNIANISNKLKRVKISKKKQNPYYASTKYLKHLYGNKQVPKKQLIKRKLMKEAFHENLQQIKRRSSAKKIQKTMMPYNEVFAQKKFPSRFAIKLGDRIYDSRQLAYWLKSHPSLPRPFDHIQLSNANKEKVQRYDRRKLFRHGKRTVNLNSNEYHALDPKNKRRRILHAIELIDRTY